MGIMSVRRRILFFSDDEGGQPGALVTIVGSIASFIAKKVTQIKELKVAIEPVQSGSGDPSPTNIRPITGWTGASVNLTGKNLLNPNDSKIVNATITATGEYTLDDGRITTWFIPCEPNVTLTFSTKKGTTVKPSALTTPFIGIAVYDENFNYLTRATANGSTHVSVTTPSNAAYVRVFEQITNTVVASPLTASVFSYFEQQLEVSSSETAYEAFGTTTPISWQTEAGTVYGGTLTVNQDGSVDLVADRIFIQPIPNNFNNYKSLTTAQGIDRFVVKYTGLVEGSITGGATLKGRCSHFKYKGGWDITGEAKLYIDTQFACFFPTSLGCTSLTGLKNWIQSQIDAGTPLQIVYPLKNIQTYHLDSIDQLYTLKGENNIWADCGDVTVTAAGIQEITPSSAQALNMLLGGMYTNNHTADDVSDDEALDIILGGSNA